MSTDIPKPLRDRLLMAIEGTLILSPKQFRFIDGPVFDVLEEGPRTGLSESGSQFSNLTPLIEAIWPYLYQNFYAKPNSNVLSAPTQGMSFDANFVASLMAANTSSMAWRPMWIVIEMRADGAAIVKKGERFRLALPGHYSFLESWNRIPAVGDWVELLAHKESRDLSSGFYYAFGETLGCGFDDADMVRVYFHVVPEGAPVLITLLTTRLNRFGVPFGLKCLTDPVHYDRADGVVLFIARRFVTIGFEQIADAHEHLDPYLQSGTPVFTKEIMKGMAIAEDMGSGSSFGQSRCRLLARGIVDSWMAGKSTSEDKLRSIVETFSVAGLNLAKPYLRAGTSDHSEWLDELETQVCSVASQRFRTNPTSEVRGDFLNVADRIARRLCRDAIWSLGKCNWMTWSPERHNRSTNLAYRSLPACFYDGLAGVAFFLAHVSRQTGDGTVRRTMRGAVNQLLVMADHLSDAPLSYFTGMAGVGHTLIRIGELEEDETLVKNGLAYIGQSCNRAVDQSKLSYFSGCAGLIPILIELGKRYSRAEFLKSAARHSRVLVESAIAEEGVISWPSARSRGENLVGLAEGTTGIICGLADCFVINRQAALREAITKALWFERKELNRTKGIWPGRQLSADSDASKALFSGAISDGAAGIALARLHLLQLFGPNRAIEQDLEKALQPTREFVVQPLSFDKEHFGFWHGRTGGAEAMLQASEYLKAPLLQKTAEDFGRIGLDAYERNELPWPCGLPDQKESVGLMTGLAGIGYSYLRLQDPSGVPPLILL